MQAGGLSTFCACVVQSADACASQQSSEMTGLAVEVVRIQLGGHDAAHTSAFVLCRQATQISSSSARPTTRLELQPQRSS